MERRAFIATVGGVSALAVAGCTGGGSPTVEETTDVTMVDTQFDPRNIHADVGATVSWTNEDDTSHTVTAASDNWAKDSEVAAGAETTHTFGESGVYDVYCRFDGDADLSGMSMRVSIGDATIESPLGDGGDGGYY